MQAAIATARESGEALPLWSQIIFISLGAGAVAAAYVLWRRAVRQDGTRDFALLGLAALLLLGGGYLLIAELPQRAGKRRPGRAAWAERHGDVRHRHGALSAWNWLGAGIFAVSEHQRQVILSYRLLFALCDAVRRYGDCL